MHKNVNNHGHVLNYTPDLPDSRDLIYQAPPKPQELPITVDLRPLMPPVLDQGQLSSCQSNAIIGGNLAFLQLQQLKNPNVKGPEEYQQGIFIPPSRLFGYYNARALEGDPQVDAGAYNRDVIKTLANLGVCDEIVWPYYAPLVTTKPTAQAYTEAVSYKISKYQRITNTQNMLHCLASGYPFTFGFALYQSFYSIGSNGIVPMPTATDKLMGGHSVLAVGYDQANKLFIVRNSWGTGWGAQGHCLFPYSYIQSSLCSDFWTISL